MRNDTQRTFLIVQILLSRNAAFPVFVKVFVILKSMIAASMQHYEQETMPSVVVPKCGNPIKSNPPISVFITLLVLLESRILAYNHATERQHTSSYKNSLKDQIGLLEHPHVLNSSKSSIVASTQSCNRETWSNSSILRMEGNLNRSCFGVFVAPEPMNICQGRRRDTWNLSYS